MSGGQTANVVLTIEGVNDAPVAHDDVYAVLEDVPFIAELPHASSVLSNDSDADTGAVLTASLVDSTSHGSLTFNADGTFIYVPDAEFSGTDHFTYRLNDGFVDSNVATVEIQVIALNDAPVAHDDKATTDAHTAMSGNVLGNDTDVDRDALVVTAIAALAPGDVLTKIAISEIMDNPADVPGLYRRVVRGFQCRSGPGRLERLDDQNRQQHDRRRQPLALGRPVRRLFRVRCQ